MPRLLPPSRTRSVASLSTLPPELKLKIVEEVYKNALEYGWSRKDPTFGRSARLTCEGKLTDLAFLSLASREWHELCTPKLWDSLRLNGGISWNHVFLINHILPKRGHHVASLALDLYDEDIFVDGLDQQRKLLYSRVQELDSEDADEHAPLDANALQDVIVSCVLGACPELQALRLVVRDQSPCRRTLQVLKTNAAYRRLTTVHLSVYDVPSEAVSLFASFFAKYASVLHLEIDIERGISTTSVDKLAQICASSLATLKLLHPPASFLQTLHLSCMVKVLHLVADSLVYYPMSCITDFLGQFSDSLESLSLENIHSTSSNLPALSLPKLRRLEVMSRDCESFPLRLFSNCPTEELVYAGSEDDVFTLHPVLKACFDSLRTFTYGDNNLYVSGRYRLPAEVEAELERIKLWCGTNNVECVLPQVVIPSRGSSDYDYDDRDDDSDYYNNDYYDPDEDSDLDRRIVSGW
ncbi:hypothetical protein JCM11251_003232 [Rhodosporidiobolus azoricus]